MYVPMERSSDVLTNVLSKWNGKSGSNAMISFVAASRSVQEMSVGFESVRTTMRRVKEGGRGGGSGGDDRGGGLGGGFGCGGGDGGKMNGTEKLSVWFSVKVPPSAKTSPSVRRSFHEPSPKLQQRPSP
eukprot:2711488-Pleurochrysis_carterae.AAC.1